MAKLINEEGIEIGEISQGELLDYVAFYANAPVIDPRPFTAAIVTHKVFAKLAASPDFNGVRVDLVKKTPDSTDIFVLVSAVDSGRKSILQDDAHVQLIACPSAACPP